MIRRAIQFETQPPYEATPELAAAVRRAENAVQRPLVWQSVRCPYCGKVATEATPGSTVKVKCRECKQTSAVTIAA